MRFEPHGEYTYRPLDSEALEEAWDDARGKEVAGAPRGLHFSVIYTTPPTPKSPPLTPQQRREQFLKTKYGITTQDYQRMAKSQDGSCAICREPCSTGKRLAVDHDHDTGEIRGLLCMRCNVGLGYFREDPIRLESALRYLRKSRSRGPNPVTFKGANKCAQNQDLDEAA